MEPYTVDIASEDEMVDAVAYLALHYQLMERSADRALMVLPKSQWWTFLFQAVISMMAQNVFQEPAMNAPKAVKQIPQGTKRVELRLVGK